MGQSLFPPHHFVQTTSAANANPCPALHDLHHRVLGQTEDAANQAVAEAIRADGRLISLIVIIVEVRIPESNLRPRRGP